MARIMDIRGICIASVVLQTVIFGSGSAFTKLAYESISPLWALAIRFGLASAVFAIAVRAAHRAGAARRAPGRLAAGGAVHGGFWYISCNVALDLTTATNVGFMALPVVFTPILAAVVLRRRYRLVHLPFQVAVVGGLYLLCSSGGSFTFGWGELCGLLTAVSLAGALVFGERGLARMDVVTVSATQIFATFAFSLAGALLFDRPLDVAAVQPLAWGTVAFLALASTCLTFALQNMALVRLPSATVSMLLTGEPIFTALFSWGVLGETLSTAGLVGAAVIVVCVVAETWVDGRLDEKAGAAEGAAADTLPAAAPAPAFGGEPAMLGEPAYAAATSVRGPVALPVAFVPPHPAYEQGLAVFQQRGAASRRGASLLEGAAGRMPAVRTQAVSTASAVSLQTSVPFRSLCIGGVCGKPTRRAFHGFTAGRRIQDIFLAGIGAMAITAEKSKDLVDQLISKGELTVDQGKQINTELKHKAEDVASTLRYDALEARMAVMTPEERAAFAAKAAEIAAKQSAQAPVAAPSADSPEPQAEVGDASPVETSAAESAAVEIPIEGGSPASPQTPGA